MEQYQEQAPEEVPHSRSPHSEVTPLLSRSIKQQPDGDEPLSPFSQYPPLWKSTRAVVPQVLGSLRARTRFFFCVAVLLVASQIIFQVYGIPRLIKSKGFYVSITAIIGFPALVDHFLALAWIPITNDLDEYFHDRLRSWDELKKTTPNGKERKHSTARDALRKCDGLDDIIHITLTKVSIIIMSLIQAFGPSIGYGWAFGCSILLIVANILFRYMFGQFSAILQNWNKRVERYDAFDRGTYRQYKQAWKDYSRSRWERERSDEIREITWEVVLFFVIVFTIPKQTPIAIFAKMLKDVYSLDAHMDKIVRSSVPTFILLKYCWVRNDELRRGKGHIDAGSSNDDEDQERAEEGQQSSYRDELVDQGQIMEQLAFEDSQPCLVNV